MKVDSGVPINVWAFAQMICSIIPKNPDQHDASINFVLLQTVYISKSNYLYGFDSSDPLLTSQSYNNPLIVLIIQWQKRDK